MSDTRKRIMRIVIDNMEVLDNDRIIRDASTEASRTVSDDGILLLVLTGGREGGSCWGSRSHHFHADAPAVPPPLLLLSDLINAINPEMPFSAFEHIWGCVKIDKEEKTEYYGNSKSYDSYELRFSDLAKVMDSRGIAFAMEDPEDSPCLG